MPPNTVKVDRTTKWGNPFRPNREHDRAYCAQLFAYLAAGMICMCDDPPPAKQTKYLKMAKANIEELRGKNLACWCAPDAPCHADTLLQAANKRRRAPRVNT